MARDVVFDKSEPAVQEVTAGQVRTAIRKFRDYSQDLEYADYNTFDDRIRVFVNFCQKDPVFSGIRSQLRSNPHVDFEDWLENGTSKGTGMAGSGSLNFPVDEDDRLSLMYQLVEAAAEPKYAIIDRGTYWFAVGSSSIDDYIRAFSDAVMRPLFRDLGYKLEEIEDQLPSEKDARVSTATLQIIHVERADIRMEKHQSFAFTDSKNIQVGDGNVQDNRAIDLDVTLRQIVERIDKADSPRGSKDEAKGRLQKFLEHPLVSAIVGGATSAVLTPK